MVINTATGALKVVTPVLKTNVIVCPEVIGFRVVTVRALPNVL